MADWLHGFVAQVQPHPQPGWLEAGQQVLLGDTVYETISLPGHAWGQIGFYDPKGRTFFCGDHVLPRLAPNVSLVPEVDDNPLRTYLESLQSVTSLAVDRVYPGHGAPFGDWASRCRQIIRHHEERAADCLARMNQWLTARELCGLVYGKLSLPRLRFALSETIARLLYWEQAGRVERKLTAEGKVCFRRIG